MYEEAREVIDTEIKNSDMFSIIVDECKDSSRHEQFSICLRYVTDKGKTICNIRAR